MSVLIRENPLLVMNPKEDSEGGQPGSIFFNSGRVTIMIYKKID